MINTTSQRELDASGIDTGIMHRHDGVYIGPWNANRERQGEGTFTSSTGERYSGEWYMDRRHGLGRMTCISGSYEGGWRHDQMHGDGVYSYREGGQYDGEWAYGKRHGEGIHCYPGGAMYVGQWRKGWPTRILENNAIFTFDNISELATLFHETQARRKRAIILQANYDGNGAFQPAQQQCGQLSQALAMSGYDARAIHFHTPEDLHRQFSSLTDRIDLVWLRAHGNKTTFQYGPSPTASAGLEALVPLFDILSANPHFIFESCNTGQSGGLAESVRDHLSRTGKRPTISAPDGEPVYRGFDVRALAERNELFTPMLTEDGRNVAKIFKCESDPTAQ